MNPLTKLEQFEILSRDEGPAAVRKFHKYAPELIALWKAAKAATKDGNIPEGYTFTKEDAEQYLNLDLAVQALERKG